MPFVPSRATPKGIASTVTTTPTQPASIKLLQCFLCHKFSHHSRYCPYRALYVEKYGDPYPDKIEADNNTYKDFYPTLEPNDDEDNFAKTVVMMMSTPF